MHVSCPQNFAAKTRVKMVAPAFLLQIVPVTAVSVRPGTPAIIVKVKKKCLQSSHSARLADLSLVGQIEP